MHKDHYENIFCVASGKKHFTICPPSDAILFEEKEFPSGIFCHGCDGWTVDIQKGTEDDDNGDDGLKTSQKVRWIEPDIERIIESVPLKSRQKYIEKFPLLKYVHPLKVTLEAGDMFYLPSLWYHRVTQSCETVAVNYWYDMRFDSPSWCYFNFLQSLHSSKDNSESVDDDKDQV